MRLSESPSQDRSTSRTVVQLMDFRPRTSRSLDVFLLLLAESLRDRGWRTVHIFSAEPSGAFRDRLGELQSPWHVTRFPIHAAEARRLAGIIRPLKPTVLQTMFMSAFNPALWWLKRASRAGSWVVVDQSSGACSPKVGMRRLIAKARGAVAGRIIDRIIAVSEFVARRDVEQNMLPLDRVTTIYNGVDLGRFRAESIRAAKDGAFTIVFAGQLIPEKGVDLLVEAVRRVAAAPGARLEMKVAGTGRLRGELERLASEVLPGRVEFLGQVEDVPALFRSADLAIFPSRWQEAFGLVIAEAMACRTPVIASDAGGIPEVVGADGLAGLVFRNGDVDGLERQIRILLADPERRARMGQAGRERVEREFSITRMVEKYAALYEELAMQTGR